MKYFLFFIFNIFFLFAFAQQKDTLSKQQEVLLRLVGGFVKKSMQDVLKENGTPNGIKSVIGNGFKEVIKNTVQKTAGALAGEGLNFGNALLLPDVLQKQKEALFNKGKGELINNFHQSLKIAAGNAFAASLPVFVTQALDFNIDDVIKFANSDTLSVTDIFKNANKNTLVKIAVPLAKNALKLAGGKRMYKKVKKAFKKTTGQKFDFNSEDFIAGAVTDYFFKEMKIQELMLKQNPSSLLERLKGLFKNNEP
jgi:hypothetical protein